STYPPYRPIYDLQGQAAPFHRRRSTGRFPPTPSRQRWVTSSNSYKMRGLTADPRGVDHWKIWVLQYTVGGSTASADPFGMRKVCVLQFDCMRRYPKLVGVNCVYLRVINRRSFKVVFVSR